MLTDDVPDPDRIDLLLGLHPAPPE
jgi:hypothetical protein